MFVLPKPFELENSPTESRDLIIRLTIYGFSRLYSTYQLQALEKFFKDAYCDVVYEPLSGESEEDCRMRTFMELCNKSSTYDRHNLYPFTVVEMLKQQIKDTHGVSQDHRLHFAESFLGLSVIWFKGQTVDVQRLVTQELTDIVEGSITEETLSNESEEDFVLRIFTELCKKVDFLTQVQFLEFVEQKRPNDLTYFWHEKLLIKPQDSHSAAELLSRLCIFGLSLLSAADQQQKIQKISTKESQHEAAIVERDEKESEEHFGMKTFTELINKFPVDFRVQLFSELVRHFLDQEFRHPCLPIEFLRQQKLVQNLCATYPLGPDQAEAQKSNPKDQGQPTDSEDLIPETVSRYPEFLFGVAVLWFKTRCASSPTEPIHVLLGQVEVGDAKEKLPDETEEDFRVRGFGEWFRKLPFESQQRFVKYIRATIFHDVRSLHETSSPRIYREYPYDIIYPIKYHRRGGKASRARFNSGEHYHPFFKDKNLNLSVLAWGKGGATVQLPAGRVSTVIDEHYHQFIKVKNPNLRVLGGGGGGGVTQAGGGGGGGGGGVTQGDT